MSNFSYRKDDMTDDDRKSIVSGFHVSLFKDFEIDLAEVFEDIE